MSYTPRTFYAVELEDGVFVASGRGDPARTLVLQNAKVMCRRATAERAIKQAREYRPFKNAKVIEVVYTLKP